MDLDDFKAICEELSSAKTNHEYYLEKIQTALFSDKTKLSMENVSLVTQAICKISKFPQPKALEDEKSSFKESDTISFMKILSKIICNITSEILNEVLLQNINKVCVLLACIKICQKQFSWMVDFPGIVKLEEVFNETFLVKGYVPEKYVTPILNEVKNYLGNSTWKNHMEGYATYQYIVLHLNRKSISSNLTTLLPFALTLTDDYNENFVVNGMKFISLFLNQVPMATFRRLGWGEVVYDAIKKRLYSNDSGIINVTLSTLLQALNMIENNPKSAHFKRAMSKYNEVFQIIITNLQMTSSQVMRRVYAKHLSSYIQTMGITVVWNLKDTLETFEGAFEYADTTTAKYLIRAISTLISVAWPRMKNHGQFIVKILLKLMYDIELKYSTKPSSITKDQLQSIINDIVRCMAQIFILLPNLGKSTLSMMKSSVIPAFNKNCVLLAQYFPACELDNED